MKLKTFLFFCSLLLTIQTSLAAPLPLQIIQTPPQTPGDRAIRIKVHTGKEYCYTPTFVEGEGYVYIGDCNYAKLARYDLFQRIAWKVDNVWLCMTAPNSVTGIEGKSTANWDYIVLRPCVINDPNQQWVIKKNTSNKDAFYTAKGNFRIKDTKWYTYISKNPHDYYDHTLIPTMNRWEHIVATPVNINLKMSIGWNFASGPSFSRYYITDDGSKSDVFDLYYNPENGHIARYFSSTGAMSCMFSQQSSSENWDWVKWALCKDKDTVTPQRDIFSWDIVFYARREGTLTDYQGNFLRVTQHGPNWGTPYTAKPSYLEKDTTNSPKSNFIFPHDMERWNRYVNGNLGDTLAHCPAPGKKENIAKTRVKRSLPPDFTFTDAWINRLWQIAISSTPAGLEGIGICGPCMVQTLQMLVELQERYQREPLQDGNGYFFNTQAGVDLFPSLRARFPELTQRLDTIRFNHDIPYHVGEDFMTRMSRLGRAVALTMLPQYEWRPLTLARNQEEMLSRIRDILYAPVGTLWFSVAIRQGERGLFLGHAQPIIRTGNGVIVLPTNTYGTTFEQFSRYFTPITDPNIVLHELSQSSSSRIQTQSIAFFQMAHLNEIPLSLYVSQRNCTGEGDDRRGNKEFPRSSLINQCGSGRCAIQ